MVRPQVEDDSVRFIVVVHDKFGVAKTLATKLSQRIELAQNSPFAQEGETLDSNTNWKVIYVSSGEMLLEV